MNDRPSGILRQDLLQGSERENAAERQGQERHLGRTAKPNTKLKTRKGGTAMFEDYYMTADDVAKALKISKSIMRTNAVTMAARCAYTLQRRDDACRS